MDLEITVETVCQFIVDHGGKVKNTILVSHFKKILNNPATKDVARQKFKECVNTVAVVKTENGDKYVQLKKKYRSTSSSATSSSSELSAEGASSATAEEHVEHIESSKNTEADGAHNKSFNPPEDLPYADSSKHEKSSRHSPSHKLAEKMPHSSSDELLKKAKSDVVSEHSTKEKKSVHKSVSKNQEEHANKQNLSVVGKEKYLGDQESVTASNIHAEPKTMKQDSNDKEHPRIEKRSVQESVSKIQEEHDRQKEGEIVRKEKSASKFQKPKFMKQHSNDKGDTLAPLSEASSDNDGFLVPPAVSLRKKKDRKENLPPSPIPEHLGTRWTSVDRLKSSFLSSSGDQRSNRARPISIIQGNYVGSVEKARQSFQPKLKLEDSASLALSERSLDSKGEDLDYDDDRNIPSIALDINEKAWIIRSAQGNLVEMRKLLNVDDTLANKKDFVMGYSALHWAAKKGNADMVNMLIDQKVDVNIRSNGGYTPLHIAAMHGHEHIISLLIDVGADGNIRDYSGHQPIHYLKSVSLPLQKILFGNDTSHLHTPIKEFASGLRPRIDSVRKAQYRLISGGFSSVGSFVTSSKAHEDHHRSSDLDQDFSRTGSLKSKMNKLKKGKKSKDDKPKISVVSVDDSDSGFNTRLNATMSNMSLSSSPLPRRAGNYNVAQQRRTSSKSGPEFD